MANVYYQSDKIPKWKFWLARFLGVKRVTRDGHTTLTFYYFNGCYYLWSEYTWDDSQS